MSFLGRLGLSSKSVSETNHGANESSTVAVVVATRPQHVKLHSSIHIGPKSATDNLIFDTNIFSSESIVVGDGYTVAVMLSGVNGLAVFDHKQELRAQIICDQPIIVRDASALIREGDVMTLPPGDYLIAPDDDGDFLAEYYFLLIS